MIRIIEGTRALEGNNYSFDENATAGSIWGEPGLDTLSFLDRVCEPGQIWADIPSGDGRYTQSLLDRGIDRVIAADFDYKGLIKNQMVNTKREDRDRVSSIKIDIHEGLPFPDNSLDGALTIGTLQLFQPNEVKNHLHEIQRVVKPGGHFIMNLPAEVFRNGLRDNKEIVFSGEHKYSIDESLRIITRSFPKSRIEIIKESKQTHMFPQAEPPYSWTSVGIMVLVTF